MASIYTLKDGKMIHNNKIACTCGDYVSLKEYAVLESKTEDLKYELDKTYNQLMEVEKESQERIAELESELETKVNFETDRLVKLPFDPLETANMLINATYKAEIPFLERQVDRNVYDVGDLEQIAEHLLVYCKHNREEVK